MNIMRNSKNKLKNMVYFCVLTICCLALVGCQPKAVTNAKFYLKNNDWEKALKQLEIATEAYPQNAEAHFLLGQVYGYYARYEDMMNEYESSLQISDKFMLEITNERERHWIDNYNAGIIALDKQDYKNAEVIFKNTILIDSTKHEAYEKLAITYVRLHQTDSALAIYNKLLEKDPDDLDILVSMGDIYTGQNNYNGTICILEKVLEISPQNRNALANLALAYESAGKFEEAEQTFQTAVSANTFDKELISLFGVHYYKRKNFEQAVMLFKRVLERHPHDFDASSNIGCAYLSMAEKLKNKLKTANKGSSTFSEIQKTKNQALLYYQKAIPYLKKAIELQPNHPILWRNLGVAYINIGEKEKGEEAFIKSQELQTQMSK